MTSTQINQPRRWLLAGGTGLIGQHLAKVLREKGHEVKVLSRKGPEGWAPGEKPLPASVFRDIDVVVNLAGASVGEGRWTPARKRELLSSRLAPIQTLQESLEQVENKPFVIQASAIGYYGTMAQDADFTEQNGPGEDFLANLCVAWEAAAKRFEPVSGGLAIVRIGVVLDAQGGAFPKMIFPIRWFAGAAPGSGQQGVSWIHIDDVIQAILFIEENRHQGVFNLVAPDPQSMQSFMKEAARQLHRPFWPFPLPGMLLKMAMGEQADLVLKGNRVYPSRLLDAGYTFRFSTLPNALKNLFTLQP